MLFNKQLFRHEPNNDVWGDCWRTAIACFFDLPPDQVPHFFEGGASGDEGDKATRLWLAQHGYGMATVAFDVPDLDTALATAKHVAGDTYALLTGFSRTGCNHTVIVKDGGIAWDPSLTDAGIIGPADTGYFYLHFFIVDTPRLLAAA